MISNHWLQKTKTLTRGRSPMYSERALKSRLLSGFGNELSLLEPPCLLLELLIFCCLVIVRNCGSQYERITSCTRSKTLKIISRWIKELQLLLCKGTRIRCVEFLEICSRETPWTYGVKKLVT